LRFDRESIDAHRAEHGGKEAHRPEAQEEERRFVRKPGSIQERDETGEDRDGADRPEGPLEPLCGPNHLAACGMDESQVERVQQPRTGEQGGQQTGEEEDRERHEADHELTKVGRP